MENADNLLDAKEVNKIDLLSKRIEEYKQEILTQIDYFIEQHAYYIGLVEKTGFTDPESDPVLLGPGMLGRIQSWYALARVQAYAISGKCRDLQKFYLAAAEQGKSNQYERVRLGKYDARMNNATDAKEVSRRVSGRLEEKASYWEGEYLRWNGAGDAYEHLILSAKDQFKLAEYEYHLLKGKG